MAKRTIYVSKKNPRMSLESLEKFGYTGKTPEEVLANVRRHYPKAKKGSGWHGESRRHAEAARNTHHTQKKTDYSVARTIVEQIQASLNGTDRMLFKSAVRYKKIRLIAKEKGLILFDGSRRLEITYNFGSDLYDVDDGKHKSHDVYNDQLGDIVKDRFKRWF